MSEIIEREAETAERVGLCGRKLRQLEAEGLFPKSFKISPSAKSRAKGRLKSEIDAWIEARAASRTEAA